jgi:hypothetical protein
MFLIRIFFLAVLLAFVSFSSAFAQSDAWDATFISRHAVSTFNINVGRLFNENKKSNTLSELTKLCKVRHGIDLLDVDQFQFVFSNDPQLEFGADTTSNTKIVFREPQTFSSETVGTISRYKLVLDKHGGQELFVGKRIGGIWGGMVGGDRSLTLGVAPMLKSILDSQKQKLDPAHEISTLRKTDVDVCITISGGASASEFASRLFGGDHFSLVAGNLTSGLIYLDTQSEIPINATLLSENPKELAIEIQKLIDTGNASLDEFVAMADKQLEQMKKQNAPAEFTESTKAFRDTLIYFSDLLKSLEIKSTKSSVLVATTSKSLASQLPQRLASLYLQD